MLSLVAGSIACLLGKAMLLDLCRCFTCAVIVVSGRRQHIKQRSCLMGFSAGTIAFLTLAQM